MDDRMCGSGFVSGSYFSGAPNLQIAYFIRKLLDHRL